MIHDMLYKLCTDWLPNTEASLSLISHTPGFIICKRENTYPFICSLLYKCNPTYHVTLAVIGILYHLLSCVLWYDYDIQYHFLSPQDGLKVDLLFIWLSVHCYVYKMYYIFCVAGWMHIQTIYIISLTCGINVCG
jgi:hypothetical protein